MSSGKGALPAQTIREMIEAEMIAGANPDNIRPASLDLSVTELAFRVEGIFLPFPHELVTDVLGSLETVEYNLEAPLERGVTYAIKLSESLRLPQSVYAYSNPKSSTGRNGVFSRVIADNVSNFDSAEPKGFKGDLLLIVTPGYFPIKIATGTTLSQMRFFSADTRFSRTDLEISFERDRLLWVNDGSRPYHYEEVIVDEITHASLILSVDLTGDIVGWECLGVNRVLEWDRIKHYNPLDFFRPIKTRNGRVHLKEGGLYIFRTKQRVRVPPHLACEMVPMDARKGEWRTHFAGYIDPAWGWGVNGNGCGRGLVLEVKPYEDSIFRDDLPVTGVKFEKMSELPEIAYDSFSGSHYTEETDTPHLAKQFRM